MAAATIEKEASEILPAEYVEKGYVPCFNNQHLTEWYKAGGRECVVRYQNRTYYKRTATEQTEGTANIDFIIYAKSPESHEEDWYWTSEDVSRYFTVVGIKTKCLKMYPLGCGRKMR